MSNNPQTPGAGANEEAAEHNLKRAMPNIGGAAETAAATFSSTTMPAGGESETDLATSETSAPVGEKRISHSRLVLRRFWRPLGAKVGTIGLLFMIVLAIIGPHLGPWKYDEVDNFSFLTPPDSSHWFGTTQGGRDVFAMTMQGLRKSLIIGFSVSLLVELIAAFVGAGAAYFGGRAEKVVLWVIDLLLVVPSFLLIAIISQNTGGSKGSTWLFILLLVVFSWMLSARVVRAMTLSTVNLDYVNAARFMSVPSRVIITRHVLPNISSYLIIDATLGVASAIISETSLSYFGFGVQSPDVSLGTVLAEGSLTATTFPWVFLAPAVVVVVLLMFVNFVGDALRDALDPSSRSGGKA